MSTEAPAVATPTELSKVSTYLKAHEKLIIIVLCLAVGVHFYSKIINAWAAHEQRVDIAGNAAAQTAVQVAQAQALANAKAAADYAALAAQLAASNKALIAGQATRNATTKTQQATDKTLPPSDLAARWTTLLRLNPPTVQPSATGFVITPDAAVATVVELENVPTLRADLQDEQSVAANYSTQINSLLGLNDGLNKKIADDADVLAKQAKACTDDKNLLKAQARKSKFHWFLGGVVTGFLLRQAIRIPTGL